MYVFVILVFGILYCNAFDISRSKKDNFLNLFRNPVAGCWFRDCWTLNGMCYQPSLNRCCICKCSDGKTFYSNKLGCMSTKALKLELKKNGKECAFFDASVPIYSKDASIKYIPVYELDTEKKIVEISYDGGLKIDSESDRCSAGVINLHDYHGHTKIYKRNECQNLISARLENKKLYLDWHSNTSIWDDMKGQLMSVQIGCSFQSNSSCFLFQVQGNYSNGDEIIEPEEIKNCSEILTIKTTSETVILSAASSSSTSVKVGSAVCVVLLIIIAALFIVCWRKRKSTKNSLIPESRSPLINQPSGVRYEADPSIHKKKNGKCTAVPPLSTKIITTDECEYESIETTRSNGSFIKYNTLEKMKTFQCQEDSKSITGTLSKRPLPDRPVEVTNPYYAPSVSNIETIYASSTEPTFKRPPSYTSQLTRNDLDSTYASAGTLNEYDVVPTSTPHKTDISSSLSAGIEGPIYENSLSSTIECEKEPLYDAPSRFIQNEFDTNPTRNECDTNPLYTLYSSISDIKNANESLYKDDVEI